MLRRSAIQKYFTDFLLKRTKCSPARDCECYGCVLTTSWMMMMMMMMMCAFYFVEEGGNAWVSHLTPLSDSLLYADDYKYTLRMKNIICPPKIDFPKMNKMTNSFLKILFCTRDFKFKDRSFPIMMENTNTNTNDKSSFAKEADQICSNNDSSASNDRRRNASKKTGGVQIKQIISQRISCETCSSHPTICSFFINGKKKEKLWVFTGLKMSPRPIIPW